MKCEPSLMTKCFALADNPKSCFLERLHITAAGRLRSSRTRLTQKKRPAFSAERLFCRAEAALINYNKVRIARADDAFRIYEAIHVNRDPTAVHEHEVRISDQPEMLHPESLDKELFRMPPK